MSRKLIVCLDGTGNEIEKLESNVLRLYKCLVHNDNQLVHYEPGVGTLSTRSMSGRLWQKLMLPFGLIFGRGLERNVLHAYDFLCRNYATGDKLYFFGYSRGAYTARVLAGFINDFGLVAPHELHLIAPVFRAWRKLSGDDKREAHAVLRVFEQFFHITHPNIRFLGLWDTVSSMIRIKPGRGTLIQFGTHSSVDENPSVKAVRHALAIDERRRLFRHQFWTPGQTYHGNRFKKGTGQPQDVKQVWFPGTHSDIAGSIPEEEAGLTKLSIQWMREELDGLGVDHLEFRPIYYNRYVLGKEDKVTKRMGLTISAPSPTAPLHSRLKGFMALIELFPRLVRRSRWPNQKGFLGYYIPLGQYRYIPPGSDIHASAYERFDADASYRPRNLPERP